MQSFDCEIQSLIFPWNKATDQSIFGNCEEQLNQIAAEVLFDELGMLHDSSTQPSLSGIQLCSPVLFTRMALQ